MYILAYLSEFVSPDGFGNDQLPCSKEIYQYVNVEPPSSPTLKITLNYLRECVDQNREK